MERVITKNKLKIYYKTSIKSFLINISITQHIRINYKFFHLCMNVVTWEILYIPRNFIIAETKYYQKIFNVKNIIVTVGKKHNKLSISLSKTDADNTNIVIFTIIMYNGKRTYA